MKNITLWQENAMWQWQDLKDSCLATITVSNAMLVLRCLIQAKGNTLFLEREEASMIKTATAEEALQMLREGKEVYYFDLETKETAPLSKVLESVPGVYLVEDSGEPVEITIPVPTASTHYDYGIPVEDEPEESKKEYPKGKSIRKNIDTGKVKALRRAGWSINKIADEMGVSAPTISYHLKKMESEVQGET